MTEKMVFLNCPVCKCGIDVSDSGWSQICCPNCKIDIARQDWVERDVLEGMYLDRLEAAQHSVQRTAERSAEAVKRGEMEAIIKREHEA